MMKSFFETGMSIDSSQNANIISKDCGAVLVKDITVGIQRWVDLCMNSRM